MRGLEPRPVAKVISEKPSPGGKGGFMELEWFEIKNGGV